MLEPILSGIGFGLLLTVLIGPVFFAILQTALHEGFRSAVHLATGVLVSDACWILVVYLFASQLDLTGEYKLYTAWIGGMMLMGFGAAGGNRSRQVRRDARALLRSAMTPRRRRECRSGRYPRQ